MDTTNSEHKEQLRKLICECVDQSVHCPSMLEIQDMGFQLVRIEKKLLRIWEAVNEIRDMLAVRHDSSIQ